MKKYRYIYMLLVVMSCLATQAQINTAAGGSANVKANVPTTNTNVGVGTSTPKSKLDVKGNLTVGANYGGVNVAPANGAIIEGNVGIGTSLPSSKLEINSGIIGDSGLKFTQFNSASAPSLSNGKALTLDPQGNVVLTPVLNTATADSNIYSNDGTLLGDRNVNMNAKKLNFTSSLNGNSVFNIDSTTGNIGIGTTTPRAKLEILGALPDGQNFVDVNDRNVKCRIINAGYHSNNEGDRTLQLFDFPKSNIAPNQASFWFALTDRTDASRFIMQATQGGYASLRLTDATQKDYFNVSNNGTDFALLHMPKADSHVVLGGTQAWPIAHTFWVKTGSSKFDSDVFVDTHIGIGTDKFIDAVDANKEYKLSVKGRIRAEEVKVYNTWADYVFAKDYKLRSLNEVETFINKNKHLPNVPSAKEITEKGLELGEIAKVQQEKIEELTLYLIQQNKEIQELKKLVKELLDKK